MALRAGDLREAIVIEAPTEHTNAFGESTMTWAPIASRRASVRGMKTDELMSAQGMYTVATHEVECRYISGIDTGMRIQWVSRTPSRTLDIISITEGANRESHTIVCKEHVN